MDKTQIIQKIKATLKKVAPGGTVILFGSYARNAQNESSDIDLLILLDEENISTEQIQAIKYPLYDLEFETGIIISPIVLSKTEWHQKHKITPFYENVASEGVTLWSNPKKLS